MYRFIWRLLFGFSPRVLDAMQSLEHLAATGKSLIRWGDGETEILLGRSIYFQDAEPDLTRQLRQLLDQTREDVVIGLPAEPLKASLLSVLRGRRLWLRTKILWSREAKSHEVYADAFAFRRQPDGALDWLKRRAAAARFIIVVSSNRRDLDSFPNFAPPLRWIGLPERNAFSVCDRVVTEVRKTALEIVPNASLRDGLVLIAAGPTAKVLVARLSPVFICYDVGALFDFQRKPLKPVWSG